MNVPCCEQLGERYGACADVSAGCREPFTKGDMGPPKSRLTFRGEEAQRNERALELCAGASDMELVPTRRGAVRRQQGQRPSGSI